MIKSKHILLLLLCTIIVFGCKKDKTPSCPSTGEPANCEPVQNVKNFFLFKVGSWWVYEEETSGDLDTIYVTEAAHDPTNYYFDVRVYSTYQDYYYHFWPVSGATSQNCVDFGTICSRCIKVKRSKYKSGDVLGEASCFIFIPSVGDSDFNWNSQFPDNYVFVDSITSEFSIGNLDFSRTIKMHELNTRMEDYQPTNHYFSENVGLVRKELLDSMKVWNLIDYYIEP